MIRRGYRFCRLFCQAFFLLYLRGRVIHSDRVPREGAVLLVCNHQSFLDPVIAALALPRECHFMARDTLFHKTRFGRFIRYLNAFPVKRGAADIGAIKETLRRLKRGQLVTVFPEGTRSTDGTVGAMHSGVVLLAKRAGAPLVPAAVLGAYKAWPRHQKLPAPKPVVVAYGEPLTPEQMAGLSNDRCIEIVRERIVALVESYRRHPSLVI